MDFQDTIEKVGKVIDSVGVAIIVVGAIAAAVIALRGLAAHRVDVYADFRRFLGRSILLGLELLVAADIIRTVAVTPTVRSVSVLAGIVLIRTFLSFSIELETTGRWPWEKKPATT
jgi:uncharacterized membrane protein